MLSVSSKMFALILNEFVILQNFTKPDFVRFEISTKEFNSMETDFFREKAKGFFEDAKYDILELQNIIQDRH